MTKRLPVLLLLTCVFWASACSAQDNENARQTATSIANDVSANAGPAFDEAKKKFAEGSQDVREATVRNAVAVAAPSEFRRRSIEVGSPMSCTASSPNSGAFTVECTGTTKDNKKAQVSGTDPGDADATFIGTVDGAEVFRQTCLGIC